MLDIRRKTDWQARLQHYLISVANRPFKPGEHDCALFVAKGVEAMTGKNIYAQFGKYESLAQGLRALKNAGYDDHVDFIAKNFPSVLPPFAQPGDIAFVKGDIDNAGGLVQGSRIYVLKPDGAIGTMSLLDANLVFRIPYPKEKK